MSVRSCSVPNCPTLASIHCCICGLDFCSEHDDHPSKRLHQIGVNSNPNGNHHCNHHHHCCSSSTVQLKSEPIHLSCGECKAQVATSLITAACSHCCCCRINLCMMHALEHEKAHHRVSKTYRSLNNMY